MSADVIEILESPMDVTVERESSDSNGHGADLVRPQKKDIAALFNFSEKSLPYSQTRCSAFGRTKDHPCTKRHWDPSRGAIGLLFSLFYSFGASDSIFFLLVWVSQVPDGGAQFDCYAQGRTNPSYATVYHLSK